MNGPGRMLVELILGAIAIGGFMYGMHWKTVATDQRLEKQSSKGNAEILRKLEELEQQNAALIQKVDEYEAKEQIR